MWIILTHDENGWDLLLSNKKECLALIEDSENENAYPCHTESKFIDDMETLFPQARDSLEKKRAALPPKNN